jgi:hypothetical protein
MNMTSDHRRDSTFRRDKDNLVRVGRRQETVCVVSITICLVSERDGCHSASLYIAYFSQFFCFIFKYMMFTLGKAGYVSAGFKQSLDHNTRFRVCFLISLCVHNVPLLSSFISFRAGGYKR